MSKIPLLELMNQSYRILTLVRSSVGVKIRCWFQR